MIKDDKKYNNFKKRSKKQAEQSAADEAKAKADEARKAIIENNDLIQHVIEERVNAKADQIARDKIAVQLAQIPNAIAHKGVGRIEYKRFTCKELMRIFGGWFTLTYAFSTKNTDDTETDFYICSQDVSGIAVNDRPQVNPIIEREFGKKVYGFAIIAPSNAFC